VDHRTAPTDGPNALRRTPTPGRELTTGQLIEQIKKLAIALVLQG
jgi:hypothetical protein